MLERGADPNQPNQRNGLRPLHSVAYFNKIPIMVTLIKYGADIRGTFMGDITPIYTLASKEHRQALFTLCTLAKMNDRRIQLAAKKERIAAALNLPHDAPVTPTASAERAEASNQDMVWTEQDEQMLNDTTYVCELTVIRTSHIVELMLTEVSGGVPSFMLLPGALPPLPPQVEGESQDIQHARTRRDLMHQVASRVVDEMMAIGMTFREPIRNVAPGTQNDTSVFAIAAASGFVDIMRKLVNKWQEEAVGEGANDETLPLHETVLETLRRPQYEPRARTLAAKYGHSEVLEYLDRIMS